jgi:hypothetical protein
VAVAAGTARSCQQTRAQYAEWQCSPVRDMATDVAKEKHEEPRRRKCGNEKNDGERQKFLDH